MILYISIDKHEEDNLWTEPHVWNSVDNLSYYLEEIEEKHNMLIKIYKVDLEMGVIKEVKKVG